MRYVSGPIGWTLIPTWRNATEGVPYSATIVGHQCVVAGGAPGDDGGEEFEHATAVAARSVAGAGAEEDAGQLAAVVEDGTAGVALAGFGGELDHFVRELDAGGEILRAAATGHPPIAAAV